MLETYKATIHGHTIEWDGNGPDGLTDGREIKVEVTVVNGAKTLPRSDGRKMAEALEKLAALGGPKSFPDPDEWLRETRKDRPLPGRE